MKRVALTGGIATGKSHVLAVFARLGVPTIEADVVARDVVAPGTQALAAIIGRFGPSLLDPARALDRKALASIVFADAAARRDLEHIVHPAVRTAIDDWFSAREQDREAVAIAAIPLLYETGRERDFDAVVTTACDPVTQLERVMTRDGLTEEEARQRLAAQLPTAEKVRRADHVVTTDGTIEETDRQVRAVLERLQGTAHA